jgi:hypothetical protein
MFLSVPRGVRPIYRAAAQGTSAAATTLLKTMIDPNTPAPVKVRAAEPAVLVVFLSEESLWHFARPRNIAASLISCITHFDDRLASHLQSAACSQLVTRRLRLRPATPVRVSAAAIFLGDWNAIKDRPATRVPSRHHP